MKNKLNNHLKALALFMTVMILASCQYPVDQPNPPTSKNPKTLVKVVDNVGKPIAGANVAFKSLASGQTLSRVTTIDGAELGVNVPIEGERYSIKAVVPPTTPFDQTEEADRTKTIEALVPCRDTSMEIRFTPKTPIQCGDSKTMNMTITVCATVDTVVTLTTPMLSHTCDSTLLFKMDDPQNLQSIPGLTITPSIGLPSNIPKNQEFQITLKYSSARGDSMTKSGVLRITGTCSNPALKVDYTINVLIKKEFCADCNCPSDFEVRYKPDRNKYLACIGSSVDFTIPADRVVNTNKYDCRYLFSIEKNFSNSDLRTAFGYSNMELAAFNNTLDSIIVRFKPTARGYISDTLIYMIKKKAPDGTITQCQSKLRVIIDSAYGSGPVCEIVRDATNPLLITTDSTLKPCIGNFTTSKILRIKNTGECDLGPLSVSAASSAYFKVTPSTTPRIRPGDIVDITVSYTPDKGNLSTNPVPGTVTVTGCQPTTVPVVGIVNLDKKVCCHPLKAALLKWAQVQDGVNQYYSVNLIENTNALQIVNDQTKATPSVNYPTGSRTIWISAINVGTKTATLESDYASFSDYGVRVPSPGQTACDLRDGVTYNNDCSSGNSQTISVVENQLIKMSIGFIYNGVKYSYCGLIWITRIDLDKQNGVPQITFEVAYP